MQIYMGNYRETVLSDDEIEPLKASLIAAGYTIRDVPTNEWIIFAVDRKNVTGSVYHNKRGTNKMPAEIYEYLEQEVRNT